MDEELKRLILECKRKNYYNSTPGQRRNNTYDQVVRDLKKQDVPCKESDVRAAIEEEILRLYYTDITNFNIAKTIGCDYHTVYNFLKKNNLIKKTHKRSSPDPEMIKCRNDLIYRMAEDQCSSKEISEEIKHFFPKLGFSNDTINRVLHEGGFDYSTRYKPKIPTQKEKETLRLMAHKWPSSEIIRKLDISEKELRATLTKFSDLYKQAKKTWEDDMDKKHREWVTISSGMTRSEKSELIKSRIIKSCTAECGEDGSESKREVIAILGISTTYYDRIRKEYKGKKTH